MDNFRTYRTVRIGVLAFMLASVMYLWYVAQPSWEMVFDVMNNRNYDQATGAMIHTALILMVLCFAGRSGPYHTSKLERYVIAAACIIVSALALWLVAVLLLEAPAYLYGPSLVGGVAICVLMALRMSWTLRSGRVVGSARMGE